MRDSHAVVDASALVLAFTDGTAVGSAVRQQLKALVRHAPHLVDAEVGNALRRMTARGAISEQEAHRARTLARVAVTRRYGHAGRLGDRAWGLRGSVTFYDGLYVALAELIDCPLYTVDARLARAAGPTCPIELVAGT